MTKINKKESERNAPTDLRNILVATPKADAIWRSLTPIARRDFISWIESAKQPETRKRRIQRTPNMLTSGKRRPCCYALVPMDFYKVLNVTPKAKATWNTLTPTERRDYLDWINVAKDPKKYVLKIQGACDLLAKGKRRP